MFYGWWCWDAATAAEPGDSRIVSLPGLPPIRAHNSCSHVFRLDRVQAGTPHIMTAVYRVSAAAMSLLPVLHTAALQSHRCACSAAVLQCGGRAIHPWRAVVAGCRDCGQSGSLVRAATQLSPAAPDQIEIVSSIRGMCSAGPGCHSLHITTPDSIPYSCVSLYKCSLIIV